LFHAQQVQVESRAEHSELATAAKDSQGD
jgi:hypothetical protein